jgi:hypothetical protein
MGGNKRDGIILTPRDRHLLEELQILRLVDREQAKLFAPFTSTTRANARLLALTRAGLLKRTFVGTINGGRKAVYSLPGQHQRGLRRNLLARESMVAHQLAINQVYHAFRYASSPQPEIQFLEWRTVQTVLSPTVPLIPDGIVRYATSVGEQVACVEVDLGTETLRVWEKKVGLYLQLATSGESQRLLGSERFKVLVLAPGRRRTENLAKMIARRTDKLFWVTTTGAIHNADVGSVRWLRPNDSTSWLRSR